MTAVVVSSGAAFAGDNQSCEWVCREHPKRVRSLFAALDLQRPGLEKVRGAAEKADWPEACRQLIAYYRNGDTASWLRHKPPKPGKKRDKAADLILDDTFTIQRVTARQPRRKNGRLNWSHRGPNNDCEWAWLLNRHSHFLRLFGAWRSTGNPDYPRCFSRHVVDWVVSNPRPADRTHTAEWRVLEVGLRLRHSWPTSFYRFQPANGFTPAARILMLSSVPEQAGYTRDSHAGGGNHILMEMYGLANAAACWPEFKEASAWFDYAFKQMLPQMQRQVYPDGVQMELTSHYHHVSVANFDPFVDVAHRFKRPVPPAYLKGVERMWNYLAMSMRPDGHGVLNNDSDLDFSRSQVLRAARKYTRSDWIHVVTNGKQGTRPAGPPSVVFPWAHQAVMRSGFDADAHWAFFDVGPAGIGHQHNDRLHLSVAAFGRDILVDGGRYWYKGGAWRAYFTGSASHNVILVDGAGQEMGPTTIRSPMKNDHRIAPEFDFVRGSFGHGYKGVDGRATHTRAVVYLRGFCWVVVDRVQTDRPRQIDALWHFHPDCNVASDGLSVASTDPDEGNVRIVPASSPKWKLKVVKGRTKPTIQGWYSPEYNIKHPNPTAIYSAKLDRAATFAWVIVPARGKVPEVAVESLDAPGGAMRLGLTLAGAKQRDGKKFEVAVRLAGKRPVPLSGGLSLDGFCAVLRPGKPPLVALGTVTDEAGHIAARDPGTK